MLKERKLNQKGLGFFAALGLLAIAGGGAYIAGSLIVNNHNAGLLGILRQIFIFIDVQVFSVSGWAYGIFYEISSNTLLSTLNLTSATQRLYTLLGIFMLFRLAFAFVKYIINPENMEKGSSKLLANLAVSLALIVSTPWLFNRAFELQTYIIDSNVIGNLIMGMNLSANDDSSADTFNAGSYGQVISFLTFSAFFRPNAALSELTPCGNMLYYYDNTLEISVDGTELVEDPNLSSSAKKIATCVNALNKLRVEEVEGVNGVEIGTRFYIASQRYNMGVLTDPGVYNARVGETFVVDYTPVISAIAGGFLALLFLNFCFDVAVRNVKLCFLQIVAPIPIILNIEPGSSSKGDKPLNWWAKECVKSYAELFVRVATVYFGVFLINILFGSDLAVEGSTNNSTWFQVFMILGILLFVKQIPDMIGKVFGVDMKGNFNLNPLKRIGDSKLASMAVGGAAGLATGMVGGGIAAFRGARSSGAGVGQSLRRAITGGVGGGMHSMVTGGKKGAKSIGDITSNAKQNMARSGRVAAANVGTRWSDRVRASANMAVGAPTAADVDKRVVDATKEVGTMYNAAKSRAASEVMKRNGNDIRFNATTSESLRNFATTKGATDAVFDHTAGSETFRVYDAATGRYRSAGADGYTIGSYKAELAAYDAAKNEDTSAMTNAQKRTHAARLAEWERGLGLKKKFIEGESAIEWAYANDDLTKAQIDSLDAHIRNNSKIFEDSSLMGGRTISNFDIHNQKAALDAAEYVSTTHASTDAAKRHRLAAEAAKAKRGGK